MSENYTQEASDRFFDFFDKDMDSIRNDIENTPGDTDAAVWKKKIQKIASEYALSSRFAMMRILYSRATGNALGDSSAEGRCFTFSWDDHNVTFPALSMHYAENASAGDLKNYSAAFLDIASYQPDYDPDLSKELIRKALNLSKKTQLSRQEAFTLGHILGFSLEEMQWFLLRVFDQDEGFQYNRSEDVIEAYAFRTETSWFSWKTVAGMKQAYKRYRLSELISSAKSSSDVLSMQECCSQTGKTTLSDSAVSPQEALTSFVSDSFKSGAETSVSEVTALVCSSCHDESDHLECIYSFAGNTDALVRLCLEAKMFADSKTPVRKAEIYARKKIECFGLGDFLEFCSISGFSREQLVSLAVQAFSYKDVVSYHPDSDEPTPVYDGTSDISDGLNSVVRKHQLIPNEDEAVLQWMASPNHRFDLPSRTAARIYRRLAVYGYELVTGKGGRIIPVEEPDEGEGTVCSGILESIRRDTDSFLEKDGKISVEKCEEIAAALLAENAELAHSSHADLTKAWGIVTTKQTGEATSSGVLNANRMRVLDLLTGKEYVQKCDILYLLFFLFNLSWQVIPYPDNNTICNRVFDYIETAAECLNEALLPELYPPHLLEQSLLLSIVSANDAIVDADDVISTGAGPAQTYCLICDSLRETRNRSKG